MRKILPFLLLLFLFACKEKDLTTDNPGPPQENTLLATSFIYGDQGTIHPDSLLTNNLGYSFYITEVQVVLTDFFLREDQDTIITKDEPFIVSLKETDQYLVVLPPGGYSGYYGIRIGLDSVESVNIKPSKLPEGNELKNSDVFRNDGFGIDHLIIKGRLLDPLDPLDSVGKIPLEYRVGTYATSRVKGSLMKNFSISRNSSLKFVLQLDFEPIFNDFDLLNTPKITSDISNPADFLMAIDMADSLGVGLF